VIVFILFLLFVAFFLAYAIAPFFSGTFQKKKIPVERDERENLLYQKEEILMAITDLEYDYKMKKMTEADYLQQKEKLSQEAVEMMKKLDNLEAPESHHAVDPSRKKHTKVRS
jgi:hypothetical protein